MAGRGQSRLTKQQKDRLKDPKFLIALKAVAPLVQQKHKAKRQEKRNAL